MEWGAGCPWLERAASRVGSRKRTVQLSTDFATSSPRRDAPNGSRRKRRRSQRSVPSGLALLAAAGLVALAVCGLPGWIWAETVRGGARFILLRDAEGSWATSLGEATPVSKLTVDFNYESSKGLGWHRISVSRAPAKVVDVGGWASVEPAPDDLEASVRQWAGALLAKYEEVPADQRESRLIADGISKHHLSFLRVTRDGRLAMFERAPLFYLQHAFAAAGAGALALAVVLAMRRSSDRAQLDRALVRWRQRQCPACGHALPAPIPRTCPACQCSVDAVLQHALAQVGPKSEMAIDALLASREAAAVSNRAHRPSSPSAAVVVERVTPPSVS